MSEHRIFTKAKSNELSADLQQLDKKKGNAAKRKLVVMKKVIANLSMGNHEMINMFPDVCRLFEIQDVEMKRMCYHYISAYALAKPELAVSLLPTMLEDARSGTPMLMALALRNLCSIPIRDFLHESIRPLRMMLKHQDAFLRKTACYCIARLYEKDPPMVVEEGLLLELFNYTQDVNPAVVAGALTAINEIQERGDDFTLKLDRQHAMDIAELLQRTDEWAQRAILNALMCYTPQSQEDTEMMIDKVIPMLQHSNSAVVLNAIKLLLFLTNYTTTIEDYLTKKISTSLTAILSKPSELQFLALRNVILLILSKPHLIPFDVTTFFCEYNDPIYVKDTKLEIIYLLASESNLDVVLAELEEYGTDVDVQMSRKAIRALGNLAVKLEAASKPCVKTLLSLASSGIDYVVQETVMAFKNVLRRYDNFDSIVPEILNYSDKVEEPEAKAALIWIVGQYCHVIPKSEHALADLTYTFKEDPYDVQLASLTAAVKLFLRRPEVGQSLVLKLLKSATEDVDNPDVRDRGFFYWRLLSSQDKYPGTAKEVVDAEIPPISNENEQLDPVILEELELNIGTLASIYLKPVGQVFRLAKRKALSDSSAKRVGDYVKSSTSVDARRRASTVTSATSSENVERHINDYDVPAVNVNNVKKSSGLGRRLTLGKNTLTRKLSMRNFN